MDNGISSAPGITDFIKSSDKKNGNFVPYTPFKQPYFDEQEVIAKDAFLQRFKEPDFIDEYANYKLHTEFQDVGIESPFEILNKTDELGQETPDIRAKFKKGAKLDKNQYDDPKKNLYKFIQNELVLGEGKIRQPSFIAKALKSSMTAGWANMLGVDSADIHKGIDIDKEGIVYKGERLKLTPEQSKTINDFTGRISGSTDNSFWNKVGQTAASLVFDLPLLTITGGIAGGAVKAMPIVSTLSRATGVMPRMLSGIVQQSINFNVLGIPQTVESIRDRGFSGGLESIWHSTKMGGIASIGGALGSKIVRPEGLIGRTVFKNRPIMAAETGALASSFGFGFTSTKLEGGSNNDAIATGLAFAATHFTNPKAYKRVIAEQQTKNIEVFVDNVGGKYVDRDYYIKKDNTYQRIDRDAFKDKGNILPLNEQPIQATPDMQKNLVNYNSRLDHYQVIFKEELMKERVLDNAKSILDRWKKDVSPEYYQENKNILDPLAKAVAVSNISEQTAKIFGKWKIPNDAKINDSVVKISEKQSIPYHKIKEMLRNRMIEHILDTDISTEKINNSGMEESLKKDVTNVLDDIKKSKIDEAKKKDNFIFSTADVDKLIDYHKLMLGKAEPEDVGSIAYHSERLASLTKIGTQREEDKSVKKKEYVAPTVDKEANKELLAEIKRLKDEQTAKEIEQANKRAFKALQQPHMNTAEMLYGRSEESSTQKPSPEISKEKSLENKPKSNDSQIEKAGQENPKESSITITSKEEAQPASNMKEFIPEIIKDSAGKEEESSRNNARKILQEEMSKIGDTLESQGINPENWMARLLKKKLGVGRVEAAKIMYELNLPIYKGKTAKQVEDRVSNLNRNKEQNKKIDDLLNKQDEELKQLGTKKELVKTDEVVPQEELIDERTVKADIEKQTESDQLAYDEAAPENTVQRNPIPDVGDPRVLHGLEKDVDTLQKALEKSEVDLLKPGGYEKAMQIMNAMKLKKGETALDVLVDKASGLDKPIEDYTSELYQKKTKYPELKDKKKAVDSLNKELDRLGVDFKAVYNKGLDEAGRVSFVNKLLEVGENAGIDTPHHEWLHLATGALGETKVWNRLLKQAGWDGKGDILKDYNTNGSLRQAHERLAEEYADYALGYRPDNTGVYGKMKNFLRRTANWLRGNGFTGKADYFKALAEGKLKARKTSNYYRASDMMQRMKGQWESIVRGKAKSVDIIQPGQSYNIDDSFWSMLKNKGTKDAEIEYLKTVLPIGQKLSADELQSHILNSLYPIKIARSYEYVGKRENDFNILEKLSPSELKQVIKEVDRIATPSATLRRGAKYTSKIVPRNMLTDVGQTHFDEAGNPAPRLNGRRTYVNVHMGENDYTIPIYRSIDKDYNTNVEIGDTGVRHYKEKGATNSWEHLSIPGKNYGEYRMELPFDVKQGHNYSHLNSKTIHWFRGSENINSDNIYQVNEIQSQAQYMKHRLDNPIPKFEDLKPGEVINVPRQSDPDVVDILEFKRFEEGTYPNKTYNAIFEKNGKTEVYYNKYGYDRELNLGEKTDYISALAPHWERHAVRGIIQWAAEEGYGKIRFPKGDTVNKIEGYGPENPALAEQQYIKDGLTKLDTFLYERDTTGKFADETADVIMGIMEKIDPQVGGMDSIELGYNRLVYDITTGETPRWVLLKGFGDYEIISKSEARDLIIKDDADAIENWIYDLKQLAEHEQGINKYIEPVRRFYDQNIAQYLSKYRKDNLNVVKDLEGNEWYETNINSKDMEDIYLWSKRDKYETNDVSKLFEDQIVMNATTDVRQDVPTDMRAFLNKAADESYISRAVNLYRMTATPPAYMKYISPRFNAVREPIEKGLVRGVPLAVNQILKDPKGWNDGKLLRELPDVEKQGLVDALADLRKSIYDGAYPADHSPLEFVKQFNLTEGQAKVWYAYQDAVKKTREVAKEGLRNRIIKFNNSVATNILNEPDIKKFFKEDEPAITNVYRKDGSIDYKRADEVINEDPTFKEEIAEYVANKIYGTYDTRNYINDVRPATPDTWVIDGWRKSDNRNHEQQEDGSYIERVSSYAIPTRTEKLKLPAGYDKQGTAEKSKNKIVNDLKAQGYEVKAYRIGDILGQDQFWDKLSSQQLANLVNSGHVPMTDEVVQKLFASIKSGTFEEHGVKKRWIPGMHNTLEELETNLHRFVAQGVNSKYRQNNVLESREILRNWNKSLNESVKEGKYPADFDVQKQEYNYAVKYFNGLTHSDNSSIDAYRHVVSTFYTALKGSFLTQQALQGLQTTWHLARGESKIGDKAFGEGTMDAFRIAYDRVINKNRQRITDENLKPEQELVKIIQDLEDMNLMGKTYMEEMFGTGGEIKDHYAEGAEKYGSKARQVMNVMSAGIERFTRMQAAATFYKVGKAKGLQGDALTQWIGDKINESMSQWGVAGRPPALASGKVGEGTSSLVKGIEKSYFTFKTFATHNLGMYEYLYRNKMYGALASKMMVGMGLHGITKFPLMATMFAVANLFTDDDLDHTVMSWLDELDESSGTKIGTLFGRGAPAAMGIDMSRLMDEKSAFATDILSETSARSAGGMLMEAMLGAPYGYASDVFDAATAAKDHFVMDIGLDETVSESERQRITKNLSKIAPLALRNMLNAFRMNRDGIELRGKTLIKRDDLSWADVFYKAIGFNPTDINRTIEEDIKGFPNKFKRVDGKINEIKKIRAEISKDKHKRYTASEKSQELREAAQLLRDALKEKALLMASPEYKQMIKNQQRRK